MWESVLGRPPDPRQVSEAFDELCMPVAEQSVSLEPNDIEEQLGAQLDDLLNKF